MYVTAKVQFASGIKTQINILKDNLPHNTCQIYVKRLKPHLKNTQMTLECQIFYEKALE